MRRTVGSKPFPDCFQDYFSYIPNNSSRSIIMSKKVTTDDFIERATKIHKNTYDYSKVNYTKAITPVKIKCRIHGVFEQSPNAHLSGKGCRECGKKRMSDKNRTSVNEFLSKAKQKHGNKYNYDCIQYINNRTHIKIYCNTCCDHFYQSPLNHLRYGCSKCNQPMSKGEQKINDYLTSQNIVFLQEHIFDDCKHIRHLPFDFYIPSLNICIEYDGRMHSEAITHFGGEETLKKTQHRDSIKTQYCKDNNIMLIRIPYYDFDNINDVLEYVIH